MNIQKKIIKILFTAFTNIATLSIVMLNLQFSIAGDTASEIKQQFILQFIEDIKVFYLYFNILIKGYNLNNKINFSEFKSKLSKLEKINEGELKYRQKENNTLYTKSRNHTIILTVITFLLGALAYFLKLMNFTEIVASASLSFLFLLTEILFFFLVIKPWIYTTKFNLLHKIIKNIEFDETIDKIDMCEFQDNIYQNFTNRFN